MLFHPSTKGILKPRYWWCILSSHHGTHSERWCQSFLRMHDNQPSTKYSNGTLHIWCILSFTSQPSTKYSLTVALHHDAFSLHIMQQSTLLEALNIWWAESVSSNWKSFVEPVCKHHTFLISPSSLLVFCVEQLGVYLFSLACILHSSSHSCHVSLLECILP